MAEMTTASVFMSGRSQAVRIPKAFWFDTERVEIRRRGEGILLTPVVKEDPWKGLKETAGTFSEDCFGGEDAPMREYPRMGVDESVEHFEARVKDYERWRDRLEQDWRKRHGK